MVIPIKCIEEEKMRYINDLLFIANQTDLFINAKGYYQKLIDNLYQVGYYKDNESLIPQLRES